MAMRSANRRLRRLACANASTGRPCAIFSNATLSREFMTSPFGSQLHPLVDPHVSHFKHVPFLTIVKLWHSEHEMPS